VAGKMAKRMALFPASIRRAVSEQIQCCLQGCCSLIALLLWDCGCPCESLFPRQRCWLVRGRNSGIEAGKKIKTL